MENFKKLEDQITNHGNSVLTKTMKQDSLDAIQAAEKFLLDEISKGVPEHVFDKSLELTLQTIDSKFRDYYKLSTEGFKLK